MSEKGLHAHQLLSERFSNIPSWDDLSERTKDLLEKVGSSFVVHATLEDALLKVETQLEADAYAVEASLQEELGTDLVPRESLGDLDASPDEETDDEPTIH